jgi:hypothetical protein
MDYNKKLVDKLKNLLSHITSHRDFSIKVIQEIKYKDYLYLEVLISDRFYLYLGEKYIYVDNLLEYNRFMDVEKWHEDNFNKYAIVADYLMARDFFLENKDKRRFSEIEQFIPLFIEKLKLKNPKTTKRYAIDEDNSDPWGVYFDIECGNIIVHLGHRFKGEGNEYHFQLNKSGSSVATKWIGSKNKNEFRNKIDNTIESLYSSGKLKKDELYKNDDFHETVELLEEERGLSAFNKKLLKITKSEFLKPNDNELNDLSLLIDFIRKKRESVEEKNSVVDDLNNILNNLNEDEKLLILCKDNFKRAKLLLKKEKHQIQKYLEHYMKLSQKYFQEELKKIEIKLD